jgi:hypothetical protein
MVGRFGGEVNFGLRLRDSIRAAALAQSGQMTSFRDNPGMRRRLLLTCIALGVGLTGVGCALVVQYPVTSASAGVWGATGKGPSDHAMSNATGQDCDLTRVIDLQPVCQQRADVHVEERRFQPLEAKR